MKKHKGTLAVLCTVLALLVFMINPLNKTNAVFAISILMSIPAILSVGNNLDMTLFRLILRGSYIAIFFGCLFMFIVTNQQNTGVSKKEAILFSIIITAPALIFTFLFPYIYKRRKIRKKLIKDQQ